MVSQFNYIHNSSNNPLGLPFGQSHLPNARMNLFHIDNQEMHLNMIQVNYFDNTTKNLQLFQHLNLYSESGFLHLCSRSLIFDSEQLNYPLLKIRYNQQLQVDVLSGDQLIQIVQNGVNSQQNTQSNFFTSKQNESGIQKLGSGPQKVPESNKWQSQPSKDNSIPYNDSSISPINGQDQHQILFKPSHLNNTNQGKSKITVKKHAVQNKNKTQESITQMSPGKRFSQQSNNIVIKLEDPKKAQFLNEFYSFLSQNMSQAQFNQQNGSMNMTQIHESISELQLLVVSVKQVVRIPRQPPSPQYLEPQSKQFAQHDQHQYYLFVLNHDDGRQGPFFHSFYKFIQPDLISNSSNIYLSEDDILKKHIEGEKKKYLQHVKHTEQTFGQKFLIKQIVKRVTVEGEHTYLLLMKQSENDYQSVIELTPIMNAPHQTSQITIPLNQIKYVLSYRYMFEYKALRIVTFNNNLEEFIIIFKTPTHCEKALEILQKHAINNQNQQLQDIQYFQYEWLKGAISNGEYLLYLNFISHRSFNDLTQYPVFPWIIADYKNETLNLQKSMVYRDLSKPIGALSPDKMEQFKSKYYEIINKSSTLVNTLNTNMDNSEKPYMYLSHYSTPGIALYYLIRQIPTYLLKVQNEGYGGPPDRIFYDIGMSWFNGLKVLADNKELIPEFYFGEGYFLKNANRVELGLNHLEEKVDDVTLPPWASSHLDFILKNREALESNYVSENLHKWIDLVFGYLQNGERASMANNLFQPQTLEENINFSEVSSPLERQAIEAQIRNFGQCPVQIFKDYPHPERSFRSFNLQLGKQFDSVEGLEKQCELQMVEIDSLQKNYHEMTQTYEERILKQMQEFNHLDEARKKQINRYKEDSAEQIKKYKKVVEFLKQKKKALKQEIEDQYRQKENQYILMIEQLKQQLGQQKPQTTLVHQHQQLFQQTQQNLSHPVPQLRDKQVAQLTNFIDKHPGSAEYLKTLDSMPFSKEISQKSGNTHNLRDTKKKNIQGPIGGSAQASRLGGANDTQLRNAQQSNMISTSSSKQQLKVKTLNHQQ